MLAQSRENHCCRKPRLIDNNMMCIILCILAAASNSISLLFQELAEVIFRIRTRTNPIQTKKIHSGRQNSIWPYDSI